MVHYYARVALAVLFCSSLIGCGGGSNSQNSGESNSNETNTNTQAAGAETPTPSKTSEQNNASSQDSGQKYVDGIPYDVFFDQPLTVAAENNNPVMGNSGTNNPAPATGNNMASNNTPPPSPDEPAPAATETASAGWGEVLTKEQLIEEVTRIRNKLNANLNSVGNFNRELLSIQTDGATLAALAGIATEHPGDFTWKDKAKYVRDLSYEISMAAETRGRPAFEKAEGPFLNIIEILNGGSPAELPDSDDETVFSDTAERNLLMRKISENNDWLQSSISSEGDLKSKKDEIISRGQLLRALATVTNEEDYVFADEENYHTFGLDLINGSAKVVNAAKEENYSEFETGYELIKKSCNDCHFEYRNN